MEHTLILLKDGRNILVNDEIPNEKGLYYKDGEIGKRIENTYGRGIDDVEKTISQNNFYSNIKAKKIIAGIDNLPTLTYSDKVKQILKDKYGWVGSVEDLAKENGFDWENTESSARTVFRRWHQSITNKMFSLEDVKKAFFNGGDMKDIEEFNFFIQSLQQPIQLKVEVEMEQYTQNYHKDIWYNRPKITNNSILITKILKP